VVKEVVTKSLRFVLGLAQEESESTKIQVGKLARSHSTTSSKSNGAGNPSSVDHSQEVCDQREEAAINVVERIITLASKCKQLSDRSMQTYERLVEDPEMRKLEGQLQEEKH
jgi:hypothetical protein